jgi:hypothetical protein
MKMISKLLDTAERRLDEAQLLRVLSARPTLWTLIHFSSRSRNMHGRTLLSHVARGIFSGGSRWLSTICTTGLIESLFATNCSAGAAPPEAALVEDWGQMPFVTDNVSQLANLTVREDAAFTDGLWCP